MGVMDIDPLRLLEDGIRSQIAARIAQSCGASLQFPRRAQPLGFGELGTSQGSALMGLFSGGSAASEVPDRWVAKNLYPDGVAANQVSYLSMHNTLKPSSTPYTSDCRQANIITDARTPLFHELYLNP